MRNTIRRLLALAVIAAFGLTACEGWPFSPGSYGPPTVPPTRTPFIQTATPIILSPVPSISPTPLLGETTTPSTPTLQVPTASPTLTLTATATVTPPQAIKADILGCDTGIDLAHSMGEVTNAYVTISNPTPADLNDMCATLSALDEGRPHPDKTKCLPSLASGYQVTFKLTVDSTFDKHTPIQIDVTSSGTLLLRVGEAACTDIGLLLPAVGGLDIPKPIP